MVSGWLIDQEHVLSCCVAATPLASDYQRHLEPIHIQCVDVDHLPRLPDAIAMGRVGRQVIMPVYFLSPAAHLLHCLRAVQVGIDFHNQLVLSCQLWRSYHVLTAWS